MPPPVAESDNYKLLFFILDQLDVKGINWVKVAEQLGVEMVTTVQKRWSVLKKREGLCQGGAPTKPITPSKRATNSMSATPSKKAKTVKKKGNFEEESDAEEEIAYGPEEGDAEEDKHDKQDDDDDEQA